MESVEDDDLRLLKVSADLVADLRALLKRVLWKSSGTSTDLKVHRFVKGGELWRLISKIEPFQEDPQILDSHLKTFIPQLVSAYLESLRSHPQKLPSGHYTLRYAVSKTLYSFCKVRGEKVIVGFFNNEPRYLELLLSTFEKGTDTGGKDDASRDTMRWEERYILLLWLSHLMLSPFDLATISSLELHRDFTGIEYLRLPKSTPGIALRVIPICLEYLQTATRERNAAAQLLVRLTLRPDMREIDLLDPIMKWALGSLESSVKDSEVHKSLGILTFLSGLVASGSQQEVGRFTALIFELSQRLVADTSNSVSAVARKLLVKIFRNVTIHCLQTPPDGIDATTVLEEVIGLLLDFLADGDTPVRLAASKALSIITLQLDSDMSTEIIEAILGSLDENVFWEGYSRNLTAVNPLRWHGLTLTLGHLLYRRAIPTEKLPEVLNALLLALTFEQRTATGASVGTNVRDAANFGIWAISRRYATQELLAVEPSSIRALENFKYQVSIIQMLAIELIQAACLDPAGNIRRGSSAALQELIGRHPDTIVEGIPLVQIVDFHAVGLRQRAMADVAISVARLNPMYWDSIFETLLGWRGIGSVDASSRIATGQAVALLSSSQHFGKILNMFEIIRKQLKQLAPRQIEERHGLMVCLANIITSAEEHRTPGQDNVVKFHLGTSYLSVAEVENLGRFWEIFENDLHLSEKDFTSVVLRPELTATATLKLLHALSSVSWYLKANSAQNYGIPSDQKNKILDLLNFCLHRGDEVVLKETPSAVRMLALLVDTDGVKKLVESWIQFLNQGSRVGSTRSAGRVIAMGAAYRALKEKQEDQLHILDTLTLRCTTQVEVEDRIVALRSLELIISDLVSSSPLQAHPELTVRKRVLAQIGTAVLLALDDYTINERGDIGSLVRLAALDLVEKAWSSKLLLRKDEVHMNNLENDIANPTSISVIERLRAAILRLSLERLDKVRAQAARCWRLVVPVQSSRSLGTSPLEEITDTSSYIYFNSSLRYLDQPECSIEQRTAFIEGLTSSAGMGSESVLQNSRAALHDFLGSLPINPTSEDSRLSLLEAGNIFLGLLKENLTKDRVLVPLLEVVAFLFDAYILQRLSTTDFKWRNLLSLIQKSHFKSTNIQKLIIVCDVYRGLADVQVIRSDVLAKVVSMLLHPFPKIRVAAAETMYVLCHIQELKVHDWTQSPKVLKEAVEKIKKTGFI